jgi:tRNA A-37 threonylcarbamoyl transferase component Bud32
MIGRYELLGRIGAGGMAEIHLARARGAAGFAKLFVIKRLLPELAASPRQVEMFLDEARTLANLQHANIVQVIDVGTDDGAYMVLELLRGRDLRAVLGRLARRGARLPLAHAVAIAQAICLALDHAHRRAVIHRDVSPHNVFVTFDGAVKLLDFGIAKVPGGRDLTRTGTIKGKVGYMSPEQCRGEPLTAASDVFSTAIVLFELVTGRRLFEAASDFEIMRETIERDPPRPSALAPGCSAALEAIILRGLARDRRDRYATALAMHDELAALAQAEALVAPAVALGALVGELFRDDDDEPAASPCADDRDGQPPADADAMIAALGLERRTATAAPPIAEAPAMSERRTLTQEPPRRRSLVKPALVAAALAAVAAVVLGARSAGSGGDRPAGEVAADEAATPVQAPTSTTTPAPTPAPVIATPSELEPASSPKPPAEVAPQPRLRSPAPSPPARRAARPSPAVTGVAPAGPAPPPPPTPPTAPPTPPAAPRRTMPDVPAAADDLPR